MKKKTIFVILISLVLIAGLQAVEIMTQIQKLKVKLLQKKDYMN